MEEHIWRVFAQLSRYGHQPISELKAMTLTELGELSNQIGRIIEQEGRHDG